MSRSEKVDPNRLSRKPFGLKAESTLHRITLSPSNINPGETIYVNIPRLSGNNVIVPGSVGLAFNLVIGGDDKNIFVNNVGRNLISSFKVSICGETLQDTKRYDLFMTYRDLFLTEKDRKRMVRQGISPKNIRMMRAGASDAASSPTYDVKLAGIFSDKYFIPIDHPILNDHGAFYPRGLESSLMFEIGIAEVKDIVVWSSDTKAPTFVMKNLELEYSCISSDYIAREASSAYSVGKGFYYENVLLYKTIEISKPDDSIINEHVNVPRRSMSGVLCLFTERPTAGTRDSEKFINPDIESISIDINGMPNKLYSKNMLAIDLFDSMRKRMDPVGDGVDPIFFYAKDRYGLWIDVRTFPDENVHGSGFTSNSIKDGVKLEIRRKAGGTGKIDCFVFVVSDAVVEVMNSNLLSIKY